MNSRNFLILWLATFGFWSSVAGSAILYPLYMDSVGYDAGMIGLVTGMAALGGLLGRPVIGYAVDRWGTRHFLLAGALFWFLSSPLVLLTTNAAFLLLIRLVQGVGGAMFTAAALGYVGYVTPFVQRGRILSWWDTSGSAANLIVPTLVVGIAAGLGFLPSFLTCALAGLFSFVLSLWLPHVVPADSAVGRQVHFRLFARSAVGPGIFTALAGYATGGFIVLGPLVGVILGMKNVGIFIMMFSIGTLVVRPLAAPVSDRQGRAWVVLPGLVFLVFALILVSLIHEDWVGYVAPILFGIGLGSVVPGLMAMSVDGSKEAERGTAGNTFYTFWEIGIFIGSYVQGVLLQAFGLHSFLVAAAIMTFAVLGFVVYIRQRHARVLMSESVL
jgi:MFS family permease